MSIEAKKGIVFKKKVFQQKLNEAVARENNFPLTQDNLALKAESLPITSPAEIIAFPKERILHEIDGELESIKPERLISRYAKAGSEVKLGNIASIKRDVRQIDQAREVLLERQAETAIMLRAIQQNVRMQQENCATDGHLANSSGPIKSFSNSIISARGGVESILGGRQGGHEHAAGEGDHCQHNNDYGNCPEGCKKAT